MAISSVCWGHDTAVVEDEVRDFNINWTGTGVISSSGDSEVIELEAGDYMESQDWNFGAMLCALQIDKYGALGVKGIPTVKYKNAATEGGLSSEPWTLYTTAFACLGWLKIRVETPLEIGEEYQFVMLPDGSVLLTFNVELVSGFTLNLGK